MLLPLKAICTTKDIRKDGTSLIYIQYCYSSENRTLLNTEIAIPPKYWNKKKLCISPELPPMYGDFQNLNAELTSMLRLAEDLIAEGQNASVENPGAYVKSRFSPRMDIDPVAMPVPIQYRIRHSKKKQPELFSQIDEYIVSKERKVCEKALATFKSMKDHLLAYQAHINTSITFQSFDFDFYEGFVDFLAFDYQQMRRKEPVYGLKVNTIGKTIKQLRIFIADRIKRKIIAPIDLSDYRIPSEDSDAVYLTFEEIAKIYQVDLSKYSFLIPYRDMFVLACLTGLRFSDFSTLQLENMRRGMLYKKQKKTDDWVVIPLREPANQIFATHFTKTAPVFTNPEFNRHIKAIVKMAGINQSITFDFKKGNKNIEITKPKHDWITSHTARRSFCTNEFMAGTPAKLIMSISGHKTEGSFYRYIKVSAEEAAKKMQELWLQRNNMLAFSAPA